MILFVDNLSQRFDHFLAAGFDHGDKVMWAKTVEGALQLLLAHTFDEVWLDHDATEKSWEPGNGAPTFYAVAMMLAGMKFKGRVNVHCANRDGATRMMDLLKAHGIKVRRPGGRQLAEIWGGK